MRLIDADETIRAITRKFDEDFLSVGDAIETIDSMPSAQPEPIKINIDYELTKDEYEKLRKDLANAPIVLLPERKTGQWIDTGSGQECSKCHEIQYGYDSGRFYCPNCGCKMEREP